MDGNRVFAARYRLIGKLVEGGMGTVWRAEHLTLRTQVAVKLIDPAIADTLEAVTRFEREAQAAAELRSTHIVQILDYGVDEGTPYIAMELLEGESLAALLSRTGKLVPEHAARLLAQVARGLSRAHEKGVVHRDLKPDNVFITREGEEEVVKVLDFGIAKKLDRLTTGLGVKTHTGSVLGSPFYMSPEQATGLPSVDHRSDIWSFAVVAYECLTGTRPFERDTLGAVFSAISQAPLPVPSQVAPVPRGFDQWFARAAARNPCDRFQSAIEAAQHLRAVCDQPLEVWTTTAVIPTPRLDGTALSATPSDTAPPSAVTVPGTLPKRTAPWKLILAPVVAIALIVLYFTWNGKRDVPPAASALPDAQAYPTPTVRNQERAYQSSATPEDNAAEREAPETQQVGSVSAKPSAQKSKGNVPAPVATAKRAQSASAPAVLKPSPSDHPHEDVFVGF